jgi:hypothetical protein
MRAEWSGWLVFGIVWVLTLAPGFAVLWACKMRHEARPALATQKETR